MHRFEDFMHNVQLDWYIALFKMLQIVIKILIKFKKKMIKSAMKLFVVVLYRSIPHIVYT